MNSLTGRRTVIATSPAAPLFRTFIHSRIRVEIMRRDNHSPPRAVTRRPPSLHHFLSWPVTLLSLYTRSRTRVDRKKKHDWNRETRTDQISRSDTRSSLCAALQILRHSLRIQSRQNDAKRIIVPCVRSLSTFVRRVAVDLRKINV